VHRDLKPENIFLSRDEGVAGEQDNDVVKVLDFGLAKFRAGAMRQESDTQPGVLTPSHATSRPHRRACRRFSNEACRCNLPTARHLHASSSFSSSRPSEDESPRGGKATVTNNIGRALLRLTPGEVHRLQGFALRAATPRSPGVG